MYEASSNIIGYAKGNKTMSFKLLKNYIQIWNKIRCLMNIEFHSEPLYGDSAKYIKKKIKSYGNKKKQKFSR